MFVEGVAMQKLTERAAHARALNMLNQANVPYLVAGAVAFGHYTGVWRQTKDLDLFITPAALPAALDTLRQHGYTTEVLEPHWLAKANWNDWVVDLIFGFGDFRALIDDIWFQRGRPITVYGVTSRVISPEELIWTKTYVAHRERYDGADIAHVLLATADDLDWPYLLWRFGPDWELLLWQLAMFSFIYPSERHRIPLAVTDELLERLSAQIQQPQVEDPVCRGPLLDRFSYIADIERRGFWDERTRWAVRNGFDPMAVAADRHTAAHMVAAGMVRPAEVA